MTEQPMTSHSRFAIMLLILGATVGCTAAAQQAPTLPMAPEKLQHRPTNIILRLAKDGTPAINDQRVEWARLGVELQAIFSRRPEKILFMTTSPEDNVRDVRRVVAIAKKHGVQVFALPRNASSD
jgi:biopolymer transport protein ExbD